MNWPLGRTPNPYDAMQRGLDVIEAEGEEMKPQTPLPWTLTEANEGTLRISGTLDAPFRERTVARVFNATDAAFIMQATQHLDKWQDAMDALIGHHRADHPDCLFLKEITKLLTLVGDVRDDEMALADARSEDQKEER